MTESEHSGPQHAVIVGAGSGIGYHTALEFAAQGVAVTALCRRPDAFDGREVAGRIEVRRCDVTDPDQLRAALGTIAPRSVVVHTAAAGAPIAPIWDCDESSAFASLSTMVTSVWQTAHLCLQQMVAADSGLVLLASSGAADKIASARATYSMCKSAVDQLVRVVGSELELVDSAAGIAAFYPGMVDTAMQRTSRVEAQRLSGTVFGRDLDSFVSVAAANALVTPQDVAASIVELSTRIPRELNGRIWRLRTGEWSAT